MSPELRARWSEQLPGPAGTTSEAAAALLRVLPGDGFGPPAARVAAANALAGASVPVGRDPEVEGRLRAEVEGLAAGYWGLPASERRASWSDLSRRGADAARLRELEPGLDVVAPDLGDPGAVALAGLVRELFVLPGRARAVRRNAWLLEHVAEVEKWRAALAVVEQSAPALVALEPRLRAALARDFPLAAFVRGASAAPIAVPVTDTAKADVRGVRPSKRAASASSVSNSWIGSGVIFGLFMIVKLVASLGSSTKTTNYTPAPPKAYYSAPTQQGPSSAEAAAAIRKIHEDAQKALAETDDLLAGRPSKAPNTIGLMLTPAEFTPEEVAVYERYDREKDAGESPRVPSGYNSWDAAGRPRGTPRAKIQSQNRPPVLFSLMLIQSCEDYERGRARVKPPRYDEWVAAGRPSVLGEYPLIHPIP